jgi:GNAT superfamily N-acetyltransferase
MANAPNGVVLVDVLDADTVGEAADLTLRAEWNAGLPRDEVIAALLGSTVWVGARDANGRLIATARALSDTAKFAYVYDVFVDADWRGKGVGDAVMAALLAHDRVRRVRIVWLSTRDAAPYYTLLGFVNKSDAPKRPWVSTEMVLMRGLLPFMPGFAP